MIGHVRLFRAVVAAACAILAAGCKPEETWKHIELSKSDITRSARLTRVERNGYIARCYAQRNALADDLSLRPMGGNLQTKLDMVFEPFCDCYVNSFEDQASKMQVMMAMSQIDKGVIQRRHSDVPRFPNYRAAAAKVGMSDRDFEHARLEIADLADAIYVECLFRHNSD